MISNAAIVLPQLAIRTVQPARPVAAPTAGCHDDAILAVLDGPALPGETYDALFRRKEHELGALFATLAAPDARALHKRLASPRAGDAVAARFGRLVTERRNRLLAFLADWRRREALRR